MRKSPLILVCVLLVAQTVCAVTFPIEDQGDIITWEQVWPEAFSQIQTGLNQRCDIVGTQNVEYLEWVATYTVGVDVVTLTNTFGDFEQGGVTGRTHVTSDMVQQFWNTAIELTPYFVATNWYDGDDYNEWFMQTNDSGVYPSDAPFWSAAGLFAHKGIGLATNLTSNQWDHIDGGDYYFSRNYIREDTYRMMLGQRIARAPDIEGSGFNPDRFNTYYYYTENIDAYDTDGWISSTDEDEYISDYWYVELQGEHYIFTNSAVIANGWEPVFSPADATGGATVASSATSPVIFSVWLDKGYLDLMDGAATNMVWDPKDKPVVWYQDATTNYPSLSVTVTGEVWDAGSITQNQETVTCTSEWTPLTLYWTDVSNIVATGANPIARSSVSVVYTNDITLYSTNMPDYLQVKHVDELWSVMDALRHTREWGSWTNSYANPTFTTNVVYTNYSYDVTQTWDVADFASPNAMFDDWVDVADFAVVGGWLGNVKDDITTDFSEPEWYPDPSRCPAQQLFNPGELFPTNTAQPYHSVTAIRTIVDDDGEAWQGNIVDYFGAEGYWSGSGVWYYPANQSTPFTVFEGISVDKFSCSSSNLFAQLVFDYYADFEETADYLESAVAWTNATTNTADVQVYISRLTNSGGYVREPYIARLEEAAGSEFVYTTSERFGDTTNYYSNILAAFGGTIEEEDWDGGGNGETATNIYENARGGALERYWVPYTNIVSDTNGYYGVGASTNEILLTKNHDKPKDSLISEAGGGDWNVRDWYYAYNWIEGDINTDVYQFDYIWEQTRGRTNTHDAKLEKLLIIKWDVD